MTVAGPPKSARLAWLLLTIVVLLGAQLRMQMVAEVDTRVIKLPPDAKDHVFYALNLERYGVYSRSEDALRTGIPPSPDAVRNPGYPAFLYAVFSALPREHRVKGALWTQALLSTAAILLSFLLFRRFLPLSFALAAAFLVSISPHLVTANIYLLTETLFSLALLLLFLMVARFFRRPNAGNALLVGVLNGAATLVRPALQLFIVPLSLLMATRSPGRRALVWAFVALLAHVAVVGLWSARNVHAIESISDPTLQTNFLHHGLYPDFMYNGDPRSYGYPYRFDPNSPAISKDTAAVLAEFRRRFYEDPGGYTYWFLVGKPLAYWSWSYVQGMGDVFIYEVERSPYFSDAFFRATHRLMRLLHWPLVTLGMLGALIPWLPGRWRGAIATPGLFTLRAVSLLLAYYTLLHVAGAPFPRYATPLRPFLFGMAAYALYWLSWRLLPSRANHRDPASAA